MSLAFILWRMNYYRLNDMRNAELSGESVCVGEGGGGGEKSVSLRLFPHNVMYLLFLY